MNDWKDQNRTGEDPWDMPTKPERGVSASTAQQDSPEPQAAGGYGTGALGALLGAVVGAIPTLATGFFGFVSGWLALLIPFGARKGYRLFHGVRRGGYAFTVILVCSLAVSTGTSAFLAWLYDLRTEVIFFLLPILFSFFGALACRRGLQSYVNPELLEHMTQRARQENREVGGTGELYVARQQWLRPLKVSVLLSMLPELALAILLLVLAGQKDSTTLIFASLGAMLAVFTAIFVLILPSLGLFQPTAAVYIRTGEGRLWRVFLLQLNNQDTYRFTHKSGVVRMLTWERLDQDERERAKANIRRAMADVESGAIYPGSLLAMAVTPLEDLRVYKENKWRWKVRFQDSRGRWKSASIPKAYPGLSLTPGRPGLSAPVPFHWGMMLAAVVLTLAFSLAGGMVGAKLEEPPKPIGRAAVTVHMQM